MLIQQSSSIIHLDGLKRSQVVEYFHLYYDIAPCPIILIADKEGIIAAYNQAFLNWIGRDEIVGTKIDTCSPDYDKTKTDILFYKGTNNEQVRVKVGNKTIEAKDGLYSLLFLCDYNFDKSNKGYDYSILEFIGNGVIIVDTEGFIHYVNKATLQVLKMPEDELINRNLYDIFYTCKGYKPLIKHKESELLKNIKQKKKCRNEENIYRSDGEPLIIDYTLLPIENGAHTSPMVLTFRNISHQKEFEESLKENEERFRSMFQNSFDTITIMDKQGRVKFTSAKDGNVFEYVFNDVLGKDMTSRIKMEQLKNTELAFEFAFWDALANPHKSIRVEHRSRRTKDGEFIYVESIISNHINNPAINGIVVNSREITERVLVERSLSKQRNLLKAIINSTPDLIFIKDIDGHYLECNYAFCEFTGMNESEIIGKTDKDLFDPRLAAVLKSMDARTLKTADVNSNEIWFTYPDGRKVLFETLISPYLSKTGEILGIVGISRDTTERNMNEQLLRDNEARLKEVQAISQIGSFEYDLLTQKANFSDNYLSILDIDDKSIISSFRLENFIKHVHPDDQQIVLDSFQGALFEFRRYKFTYRIYTKAGSIRHIYTICNYHYDSQGNPVKLISTIQDITQQKLNEELQRNIELAKKTAEIKQQFLANMSHEMRTPMTGILGMIDFLLTTRLDNVQLDYALTIKNSANSLLNIINDVLLLSKIEAGKLRLFPRVFNIKDMLADLRSLFMALIKHKHIDLIVEVEPDVPEFVEADENRIKQVITNLLSNAVKFTDKGSIKVALLLHKETGDDLEFLIKVSDTGIGIDEEEKDILFIQFSQADSSMSRNYEGIGLGLTISRQLIQLMEGEIGVESQKGEGSTFWFTVKAKRAEGEIQKKEKQKPQIMTSNSFNAHVLVVEDKFVNSKVVTMMLESLGATADVATNGYEALDIFEPGKYQLVFMDIQMPSMDGVTTVKRLREKYSDLPPIIGLSANAMEGDAEKYIKEGMDDYLSKPVTLDVMQEKMEKWIQKKFLQEIQQEITVSETESNNKDSAIASHINDQTIKVIYQQAKGNNQMLIEIFKSFINDTEELLLSLNKCYKDKSYDKAKESAHTIKGLSATIGAIKLHETATDIDQCFKTNILDGMEDKLSLLQSNYNIVKEYIEKEHIQKLK